MKGQEVGGTGIKAYLAGHHGAHVVHVTGDRAMTEKEALLPGVHGGGGAPSAGIPATAQAPTTVETMMDLRETAHADRAELVPAVRRIGGTRIEFEAADSLEAFRTS